MEPIVTEGGTACGLVLEHLNCILVAADRKQIRYTIKITPKTLKNGKERNVEELIPHREGDRDKVIPVHKFGITGVGWRRFVLDWWTYLGNQITPTSTFEECLQILETYRMTELANKGDIQTVELLFAGWDSTNKPKMYYFQNGGYTPVIAHCNGSGGNTAWMAVKEDVTSIKTFEEGVAKVQRAIYDAHLSNKVTTGVGVNVLVITHNGISREVPYLTMKELEEKFGTTETVYMERLSSSKGESSPTAQ